jgi:hypothetical protein
MLLKYILSVVLLAGFVLMRAAAVHRGVTAPTHQSQSDDHNHGHGRERPLQHRLAHVRLL